MRSPCPRSCKIKCILDVADNCIRETRPPGADDDGCNRFPPNLPRRVSFIRVFVARVANRSKKSVMTTWDSAGRDEPRPGN